MNINVLEGKTFKDVCKESNKYDENSIRFYLRDGSGYYEMYHDQDCCENVNIEDIAGTLEDLIGSPIIVAEESSSGADNEYGHETWTFYNIGTVNGWVTIRWYGESNGYYSESVSMRFVVTQ